MTHVLTNAEVTHVEKIALIAKISSLNEELFRFKETLDQTTTNNWDLIEANNNLITELASVKIQRDGMSEQNARLKTEHNAELSRLQTELNKQKEVPSAEIERLESNNNHFKQTIDQLNKTLEVAKAELTKLRNAKVSEEHLARKIVEVYTENQKLKERLDSTTGIFQQFQTRFSQEPSDEIKTYQEQINRLLEEKTSLLGQIKSMTDSLNTAAEYNKSTNDINDKLNSENIALTKTNKTLRQHSFDRDYLLILADMAERYLEGFTKLTWWKFLTDSSNLTTPHKMFTDFRKKANLYPPTESSLGKISKIA